MSSSYLSQGRIVYMDSTWSPRPPLHLRSSHWPCWGRIWLCIYNAISELTTSTLWILQLWPRNRVSFFRFFFFFFFLLLFFLLSMSLCCKSKCNNYFRMVVKILDAGFSTQPDKTFGPSLLPQREEAHNVEWCTRSCRILVDQKSEAMSNPMKN